MATRAPKRQNLNGKAKTEAPIENRFDAAGTGRRLSGWRPSLEGPNAELRSLQTVRNRSRDTANNDWAGRRSGSQWATQLIGVGIKVRFDAIKSKARRKELQRLFDLHMAEADADGQHWFACQTLAVKSRFYAGEMFFRVRPRGLDEGFHVPVQYQMLEAEMCPQFDTDTWPGMPQGNRMIQGIELNKRDRRVAYWFWKKHPGENSLTVTPNGGDLVRVAASEVWHFYRPERIGALRGVPQLTSVITRLRNSGDFEDAVLDRQKIANLFTLFITKTLPPEYWNGEELDSVTGMPKAWQGAAPVAGLEPGMGVELRPGEDVKFANPPEAGTTHSEYMRGNWLGVAAGADLPYELLTGDIRDVSDRALRVILNEFHRLCEADQWQIIIPQVCQRFVDSFAKYAYLAGLITQEEIELISQCTHSPHAWAYVHPVQDVQAKIQEVEAGLNSRSNHINERGYDPDQIDEQRAADRKREEKLGLLDPTPAEAAAQKAKQAATDEGNTQANARADQLLATIVASANRPPPEPAPINMTAPTVNVTVQQPAVQVTNQVPEQGAPTVNVEPPVVQITNQAPELPAPVVNVAAPTVNVEPPVVQITNQAPEQTVVVELPTRVTTSLIDRDAQGNIQKVTQTETTKQ